jgi:amino acid transporter
MATTQAWWRAAIRRKVPAVSQGCVAAGLALSIFLLIGVASGVTTGAIASFLYQTYSPAGHNILSSNWVTWAIAFTVAALILAYLGIRPAGQVVLVLSGIGAAAITTMVILCWPRAALTASCGRRRSTTR